jgi:hypothetical protein
VPASRLWGAAGEATTTTLPPTTTTAAARQHTVVPPLHLPSFRPPADVPPAAPGTSSGRAGTRLSTTHRRRASDAGASTQQQPTPAGFAPAPAHKMTLPAFKRPEQAAVVHPAAKPATALAPPAHPPAPPAASNSTAARSGGRRLSHPTIQRLQ